MAPLRVLTFTSLFPSSARPRHGVFVETRLRHLVHDRPVDARVVAPVPWFPFRSPAFGPYAGFAATLREERRPCGIEVTYPRYLMLPRIGVARQPDRMAQAAMAEVDRLVRAGWTPQVIDAHYLYPDGVAASIVAERLGLPFVVTARGTDVNVLARLPGCRERILASLQRAGAVVAVSSGLKAGLVDLGLDPAAIHVLRNGVDSALFHREPARPARERHGLGDGLLALSVGNLVPEKGQDLAIEALRHLPQWTLAIVGDGPCARALRELAERLGVRDRVRFLPVLPQAALRGLYSAADVLLLTSTREGWPNVVLEAMACGTPVVATDVGAVADMITHPAHGRVVPGRDPYSIAGALREVAAGRAPAEELAAHARTFDWASISAAQFDLLRRAARGDDGVETSRAVSSVVE